MRSKHIFQSEDIFKCTMCGDCCKGYGGTFVTKKDINAISEYINTDPGSFVGKYCDISCGKPVLKQGLNKYCIFWDKVCTIHPVKPRMCKHWPFIESILVDVDNWYVMGGLCPGIHTDVPHDAVLECVKRELSKRS
jgi:Fe-S-cluster containining protein